jgi:hypothetical protein
LPNQRHEIPPGEIRFVCGEGGTEIREGESREKKGASCKAPLKLSRLSGACRAYFGAGPAVVTFGGIHNIFVATFADCTLGTLGFAGAAIDAILGNGMSHFVSPYLL